MEQTAMAYPRVGIAVWIMNDQGQVFMMKRQGSHGAGTWAPPGGKLEMGEDFLSCGARETKEEAGITIGDLEFVGTTNDVFDPEKHYITLFFRANDWNG